MARRKIYYRYEVPSTVVSIVKGICSDYTRRKKAIRDNLIEEKLVQRVCNRRGIQRHGKLQLRDNLTTNQRLCYGRRRGTTEELEF